MKLKAKEIAELLKGDLIGNPECIVDRPSKIEDAGPGSFTFLGNSKYEPFVYTSKASVVLVPKDFELLEEVATTIIKVDNVYGALGVLLNRYSAGIGPKREISPLAFIHESAQLSTNVTIGAYSIISKGVELYGDCIIYDQVYIGNNVKIGSGSIIYPGVKIYHDCIIGENCVIHANAVIGADGFGFSRGDNGEHTKIPQIGNVVIEDNIEIGSCTVVDRATMGSTIIRNGVKLDNLIQVGHNAEIGSNTVIAAQTGIGGSTKIGKKCMVGGQVGFVGHIQVADNTLIQAQSGVASNVTKANSKLYGYPAIDYQQYLRAFAYFKKLPEIVHSIREIEKRIDKYENEE
jgi:UDP-3-O-[3-hydroxymyristoyl] glucosamine N-acyltransferase